MLSWRPYLQFLAWYSRVIHKENLNRARRFFMQLSVEIEGYSTYRGIAKDILKASDEL